MSDESRALSPWNAPSVKEAGSVGVPLVAFNTRFSSWRNSEIIHQLCIALMTKGEYMLNLQQAQREDSAFWRDELQSSNEAQILYEVIKRGISITEAKASISSI